LFAGKATSKQIEGLTNLFQETSHLPVNQRAYLFATTYHETARTMQPITEYGSVRYFDKYDTGRLAAALGNTPQADGDGYMYRGRGYVQITGKANYSKASKKLGVDLVKNPDLALNPSHAAKILINGCLEGWFTGKKLSDYLNSRTTDYINARRVVNGTDKASLIADYAKQFEKALLGSPKMGLVKQASLRPTRKVAAVGWSAIFGPIIAAIVAPYLPGMSEACGGELGAAIVGAGVAASQGVLSFIFGYKTLERAE
jgi:hypothetical protein